MEFIEKYALWVIGAAFGAIGTFTGFLFKRVVSNMDTEIKSLERRVNERLDQHEQTLDELKDQHTEIRVQMASISTKIDSVKEMEGRIISRLHSIQDSLSDRRG